MNRRIGRVAGFAGSVGVTVGLVALGVNMTGAWFTDESNDTATIRTGEVDGDIITPANRDFGMLMPGGPGRSLTYTVQNAGTDAVDMYIGFNGWDGGGEGWAVSEGGSEGTVDRGVVTLVNDGDDGASYENPNANLPVEAGDVISFEYRLEGGADCAGGQPRMFVFVDGVQYNTFDSQPGQCGTALGDGWAKVTRTLPVGGTVGQAAVVLDNISDQGIGHFRNITIANRNVSFNPCAGDNEDLTISVNGGPTTNLCDTAWADGGDPILFAEDVNPGNTRDATVTIALLNTAGNEWENRTAHADISVITTQANSPQPGAGQPIQQDQPAPNDAE